MGRRPQRIEHPRVRRAKARCWSPLRHPHFTGEDVEARTRPTLPCGESGHVALGSVLLKTRCASLRTQSRALHLSGDTWHCLEVLDVPAGGALLASSGWRPHRLLNALQCTGSSLSKRCPPPRVCNAEGERPGVGRGHVPPCDRGIGSTSVTCHLALSMSPTCS